MDYIASEVADDLTDARGWGKLSWVSLAALRFVVTGLVSLAFMFGLILLFERYQADTALAGGQVQGLQQLVATGGGIGNSAVGNSARLREARAAHNARAAWDAQAQLATDQNARLAAYANQLQVLAQRAGCDAGNVDQALACAPTRPIDQSLHDLLAQTRQLYQQQAQDLIKTNAAITPLIAAYESAQVKAGASLQPALPAIEARDTVLHNLPPVVRDFGLWFFNMPLLFSATVETFLAGMFGALVVLLVLLCFPNYAPLTFGGGKYFFLRMFTGGFVAVMVFVAVESGVSVAGLADLQSAASQLSIADPTKIALMGVFAGAFSEQIASWVRGYVDSIFHNAPPPPPTTTTTTTTTTTGAAAPATTVTNTQAPYEGGAMGPGAAAGQT